ncbi:MAG TPA: hypothetical protein VFW38_08120 [Solirubrobacteraceae bacterium]|nr:hypothetical protein [Solirubrobacteraceae bacterium]
MIAMTRKRSWWWRCLRLVVAVWFAFAILRVLKQPFVLIVGLCIALLALGVAVEALHS